MDSKIVYSLYDQEFTQPYQKNFSDKLLLRGIEKTDLGTVTDPVDFIQLSKLAINHADAIVQQTANVPEELIEYAKQSGKPFLPFSEEDMLQKVSDFYDTL